MSRRARSALALLLVACGGGDPVRPPATTPPAARPSLPATYRPTGRGAAGDVFVQLFEWRWTDVATECEQVLGPAGYRAVQISPPQEHAVIAGAPWWERYQPVSYSLERSRSGTRAELVEMIARCSTAGVDVYVDAVINHMTAGAGTGSAGTTYTKYAYPGTWQQGDFHAPCGVTSYQDAASVQDCELLGLADLDTGSPTVRRRLADYLLALARLGVAGFRIDAAKHIQPVELDSVLSIVNRALAAEGRALPYVYSEVIDYGGEAVRASDYFGLGYASGGGSDVTEFRVRGVGDKFRNLSTQRVADLRTFSESTWGLVPSDKAVVFLENHDTQRDIGNPGVGYRDGQLYRLATVFLLGQPYGYPMVLSGYAFDRTTQAGRDAGPPAGMAALRCATSLEAAQVGDWVCEHRDLVVLRMVRFRRAVAGTPMVWRWDDGANAIAFSRGDRGFVAINAGASPVRVATATGLAAGEYCDLLAGCAGIRVTVAAGGTVDFTLAAGAAVVLVLGNGN